MNRVMSAYLSLIYAVAERAIEDYRKAKAKLELNPENREAQSEKEEIDRFFSGWFFSYISDFNEDIRKAARKEGAAV